MSEPPPFSRLHIYIGVRASGEGYIFGETDRYVFSLFMERGGLQHFVLLVFPFSLPEGGHVSNRSPLTRELDCALCVY